MSDEIIVYWGFSGFEVGGETQYRFDDPRRIKLDSKELDKENGLSLQFTKCPAYKDVIESTFTINSPFDFTIRSSNGQFMFDAPYTNQDFLNKYFFIRDVKSKFFTFKTPFLFFCEESLQMQQTGAYFNQNGFIDKTLIIPGKYDIGKWIRPLETPFIFKNNVESVSVSENDVLTYVNFLTDKKVILKRFHYTQEMEQLVREMSGLKRFKTEFKPLSWFYEKFSSNGIKKKVLKLIKENLV
jgi:hypothetical protein